MNRITLAVWMTLLEGILSHKKMFENSVWLQPHYEKLQKIRNALLMAMVIQPGNDSLLDQLREAALNHDLEHDDSHRAFRALMEAFELHHSGDKSVAIQHMKEAIYPDGLSFIKQSFRAQAGLADVFAGRLQKEEVTVGLQVLGEELVNPQKWVDRCLQANQNMVDAVAAVDNRIAELTGQKNESEIPNLVEGRNKLFKAFGLFMATIEDTFPENSPERTTLLGPYREELAKANAAANAKAASNVSG